MLVQTAREPQHRYLLLRVQQLFRAYPPARAASQRTTGELTSAEFLIRHRNERDLKRAYGPRV